MDQLISQRHAQRTRNGVTPLRCWLHGTPVTRPLCILAGAAVAAENFEYYLEILLGLADSPRAVRRSAHQPVPKAAASVFREGCGALLNARPILPRPVVLRLGQRMPPRVLGYIRVSTAWQAASGLGLAAQENAIRIARQRNGWVLLDIIGTRTFRWVTAMA